MGPLGWQETVFIFIVALLIFGPKKLPELGRTVGKALTQFRRASADLKSTWDREMRNIETEAAPIREAAREVTDHARSYYDYDYGDSSHDEFSGDQPSNGQTTAPQTVAQGTVSDADHAPEPQSDKPAAS
jgi:sec-independent protein translocase protein TatA